jgi:hypothetical protein
VWWNLGQRYTCERTHNGDAEPLNGWRTERQKEAMESTSVYDVLKNNRTKLQSLCPQRGYEEGTMHQYMPLVLLRHKYMWFGTRTDFFSQIPEGTELYLSQVGMSPNDQICRTFINFRNSVRWLRLMPTTNLSAKSAQNLN